MAETLGRIDSPGITPLVTWPLLPMFGSGRALEPHVAVRSFRSGSTRIEELFLLGDGSQRFRFVAHHLWPNRRLVQPNLRRNNGTVTITLGFEARINIVSVLEAQQGNLGQLRLLTRIANRSNCQTTRRTLLATLLFLIRVEHSFRHGTGMPIGRRRT